MDLSTKTLGQLDEGIRTYQIKLSSYKEERDKRFKKFLSWVEKYKDVLIGSRYSFDYYAHNSSTITIYYGYESDYDYRRDSIQVPTALLEDEKAVNDYLDTCVDDQKKEIQIAKEKAEAFALQRQIEATRKKQEEDINRLTELAAKYPNVIKNINNENS